MSEITVTGTYLILNPENSIIKVEADNFEDDDGKKVEAVEIRIDTKESDLELEIRLPVDGLKRLLLAGKKFLETGKAAYFYFDKFIVGNVGEDREETSAKEALKSV